MLRPLILTLALAAAFTSALRSQTAVVSPPDAPVTLNLGLVAISTFNPVTTVSTLENSTTLYFTATNRDTRALTVQFTSFTEVRSARPNWMYDFYQFLGFAVPTAATSLTLAPGEAKTFTYFLTNDLRENDPVQSVELPFRFRVVETGEAGTLPITVVADGRFGNTSSATVAGRVTTADGAAIANATVTVSLAFRERSRALTTTDAEGRFSVPVTSLDEIRTMAGARPLPYRSLEYFVTAEASGYAMSYRGGITPATGETTALEFALTPAAETASYTLTGERPTNGNVGYWWLKFAGQNDRVIAVQGEHPPARNQPGHIIAVDLGGNEIWRVPTADECWGLDVSPDGLTTAATCHDGVLYLVGDRGQLLHRVQLAPPGDYNGEAKFSPDGQLVFAGWGNGFKVVNVQSGTVAWQSSSQPPGEQVGSYRARWSADGQRVVTGFAGPLAVFTRGGQRLWTGNLGSSPLLLEMDAAYNVYAAGKSNELFAWDANGALRWRYRLSATSNAATRGLSSDGQLLVLPVFDGMLDAFAPDGTIRWKRFIPPVTGPQFTFGPGHNALTMQADGSRIVVGTNSNQLLVYDRQGTLLWSHVADQVPGQVANAGLPYPGINTVAIASDGQYIAAGYRDNVIRIFRRD